MSELSRQESEVLQAIQWRGYRMASTISVSTGIPQASVRRAVRSLRLKGYNISFADNNGPNGYVLGESTTTTQSIDTSGTASV